MTEPIVSLVAAVARNRVIGADNAMPWRLASDLRRFRRLTWGKPLVMGRRTFDSIGGALPGRHSIVVTRDREWKAAGVDVSHGVDDAIERAMAWASGRADEVCVVGGATIYEQAMPVADLLRLTHIEAEPEGDVLFPEWDAAEWRLVGSSDRPTGPRDDFATRYRVYRRRS